MLLEKQLCLVGYMQGICKGELGLFVTPVLSLLGGSHFDAHVWKWVTVPSDLAWSMQVIAATCLPRNNLHACVI